MGWGSGATLMSRVIKGLKDEGLKDHERERVYKVLIPAMQDLDWDTEMDCLEQDHAFDAALLELHPDFFEGWSE